MDIKEYEILIYEKNFEILPQKKNRFRKLSKRKKRRKKNFYN